MDEPKKKGLDDDEDVEAADVDLDDLEEEEDEIEDLLETDWTKEEKEY